ncbi:MAG: hypothetical protein LBV20_00130 [Treponema sp.]|jgi:hypothetical protein|nr:hypothetical protein [Treponema sp.]
MDQSWKSNSTSAMYSVPDIKPEITVLPSGNGMHRITAINPQTQSRDKPDFVMTVAFAHRVRNPRESVLKAEDMPSQSQLNPLRMFQHKEEDYGAVADYAVAYENANGERGPWSNVVSLIISG